MAPSWRSNCSESAEAMGYGVKLGATEDEKNKEKKKEKARHYYKKDKRRSSSTRGCIMRRIGRS